MRPCYTSSSFSFPPTVTTCHSPQSLSLSSQPAYFQSSTRHDMSKENLSERYILSHGRHHYQNVNLPSPSMLRFPGSSSNCFAHNSQPPTQSTASYQSCEYYRNDFTRSQQNANMGHSSELNSTGNYCLNETRIGSAQPIMNNTDDTLQYTNQTISMNTHFQVPHSQYRNPTVNQSSKRPRPPPPPPPRSGSWIGKKSVSTPIINHNDAVNRPYNHLHDHEPPSSCSETKIITCCNDSCTTESVATQQSRIYQMYHTHSALPNGVVGSNLYLNNTIKNQVSAVNCSVDNSHTHIPIQKQSVQHEQHQKRQQHLHPSQLYANHPVQMLSTSGYSQPLTTVAMSTQCQSLNTVNNSSWSKLNNGSCQQQQQQCQYPPKQFFMNNSRKEVIESVLNLLIWHHPETNFTENMNPSEIHAFHTFLLNWLAKTDATTMMTTVTTTNCLLNHQQNIPMTNTSNTNMFIAQCTRRILTHLIRILYSDTVYEEEASTDQSNKEVEDENYTMNALTNTNEFGHQDDINNDNNTSTTTNNVYMGFPSSFNSNTDGCKQSSVYSFGQTNNWTKEDNALEKIPYPTNYTNMSIDNHDNDNSCSGNSTNFSKITLTDSKILPPNTSLIELKAAAMEAIHKLAPLCQPEPKLYGRDMGIIQLLTSIHSYSLSLSEFITQTNSNNNNTSTCDQSTDTNCENNKSVMHRKDNLIMSLESCPACPVAEVAALVRLSFDSMHRNAICELGGVHALISLLRIEQMIWSQYMNSFNITTYNNNNTNMHNHQNFTTLLENSLALRRYICMALTNLTYAAPDNKAFICRRLTNLEALLAQLETGNEELKQVSASVLRNLSWRTDSKSKAALRRVCAAKRLTIAAMSAQRESTLRTTLSALWNLSAHCSHNKRAVCSVDGVFAFLLRMLHLQNPMQNLVIIENSGGILRNISTVIASHDDYRSTLHKHNCYPVLLELLRNPPSLTVVVNVCGTLWNLTCSPINNNTINTNGGNICVSSNTTINISSSNNDRLALLHLGALDIIQQLTQSKHDLIRTSSMAVYRNLTQTDKSISQNHVITSTYNFDQVNSQQNQMNDFMHLPSSTIINVTANSHDNNSSSNEQNVCCTTDGDTYYNVDISAQTTGEQQPAYKRRISSSRTSRLRFGLLSVVFEAESDDELDDDDDVDETDDDEVEREDADEAGDQTVQQNDSVVNVYNKHVDCKSDNDLSTHHRGQVYMKDNSNYRDINVKLSSNRNSEGLCDDSQLILSESTNHRQQHITNWCDEINCRGSNAIDGTGTDDEQTCVYAEEGTPFPSNSTTTSSLELNRPDERFMLSEANNFNNDIHNNVSLLLYRNDPVPHVYAVEGTPSNCNSSHLSHENSLNNSEIHLNNNIAYLPSPPEDISNLIPPLTSMNLEECEDDKYVTCHFPMPPSPPLSFPVVCKESDVMISKTDVFSSKQTPLVFSRGTSSCMSSLDLEVPLNAYQSSPESEYSDEQRSSRRRSSEVLSVGFSGQHDDDVDGSSNSSSSRFRSTNHSRNCDSEFYGTDSCADDGEEGEEDVRLPFAEEGTPQDAVSLNENTNALCFHSRSYHQSDLMKSNLNERVTNACEVDHDDVDGDDEDDDNNDNNNSQILQQCIASAMPSQNLTFNVVHSSNGNFINSTLSSTILFNAPDDSLKAFAVEDTPFGTSTKASSLSDLIITEHKPLEIDEEGDDIVAVNDMNSHSSSFNMQIPNRITTTHTSLNNIIDRCRSESIDVSHRAGSSSTSSSLNGDNSTDLLSEVIQSAMPKSGQIRLPNLCSVTDPSSSNDDCLQMYAVEGTPCVNDNLSSSSSVRNDEISIHSTATGLGPVVIAAPDMSLPLASSSSSLLSILYQQSNTTPPIPPLRTTSTLTSIADPFTKVSGLTRPRATVAPMLQSKCQSLNSPIVSRSQNISEQSSKSCLQQQDESMLRNNDCVLLQNSSIPSSSSPFYYNVGEKDDASSFSSLLSIESVGMEHSLLQECISSAMPRPKSISMLRKQQQHFQGHHENQVGQQSSSLQQPSVAVAYEVEAEHNSICSFGDKNCDNDDGNDYKSSSHKEVLNHCQTLPSSSSTSKILPYNKEASSTYKGKTILSNPSSNYSQSSHLSLKQSYHQSKKSKIPSHNLNNDNKTIMKSNGNHNNARSSSGTIHFLDHGSDDVRQQPHRQQQQPSCLNMNPQMMNTYKPRHIGSNNSIITTDSSTIATSTTNSASVSLNFNSSNTAKQIQTTNKSSCSALFGVNSSYASPLNSRHLRHITPSTANEFSLPLNTKSGLRAPSSIMTPRSFTSSNNNRCSINKQPEINIIDILNPEDITELLQQGAETVVSDLMKPCVDDNDDVSFGKHNEFDNTTTTTANINSNFQSSSNDSSLELLPELIDLEQSISFNNCNNNNENGDNIDITSDNNNSSNNSSEKPKSSILPPPSSINLTNDKSSKLISYNTSVSNIKSLKYHHHPPQQSLNKTLDNFKFNNNDNNNNNTCKIGTIEISTVSRLSSSKTNSNVNDSLINSNSKCSKNKFQPTPMITTDNTVYKYKKNVIPSVKTMNSVQKTPSHSSNNKNTVKYTTKRTIKQQPNQRISMTAPPSVKNHSLVNSRSVSAASSTSNLKSIHLSNESNIEPLHSIIPKSTNPKQISAESICAALAKQERSLRYNPSHYSTTHATTASHSKLINNNSNIGNYVKSKSGIRSLSTSSRIHHSTERSIPKSQQTKQSYPLHGSNNCIPVALSCNNYTADLNIKTPDTILPAESFGSGQMITIASKNDDINVDVPKPIRGKRKSLIGRKISSSTVTDTSAVGIPVAVKPISAVRPTLHSSNNSENIKTQILMVDKTKVTTTDTSIKLNITDKDDGNLSPKHIDGYTKCDSTKNNYNYNKSILDNNDVDIDKDKLTSPGMWIIREDLGVITDDFH